VKMVQWSFLILENCQFLYTLLGYIAWGMRSVRWYFHLVTHFCCHSLWQKLFADLAKKCQKNCIQKSHKKFCMVLLCYWSFITNLRLLCVYVYTCVMLHV
jgi:uncharacterized membrane protein